MLPWPLGPRSVGGPEARAAPWLGGRALQGTGTAFARDLQTQQLSFARLETQALRGQLHAPAAPPAPWWGDWQGDWVSF